MLNFGLHLTLVTVTSFCHGQWLMKRLISDCEHSAIHGTSITNFSAPKAQGALWEERQKECKNQRIGRSAVEFCLLLDSLWLLINELTAAVIIYT